MTARTRRPLSLIALVTLWLMLLASPAQAAPPKDASQQDCLAQGGVWVIVDLPDKVLAAGCANNPTNGNDALTQIGVTITTTEKGMVCELQGRPEKFCADHQGFNKATGEYWGYWLKANPNTEWTPSLKGAAARKPAAGSIEGWRLGKDVAPRDQTQAVPAPPMPPTSSTPWALIGTAATLMVVGLVVGLWLRRRASRASAAGEMDDQD